MIVIGDVVRLREQLQFFENQLLWGKRYLVPKIGRKPSRLAALLRAQGAFVQEVTVGEIAGIHALYGAAELADVDMFFYLQARMAWIALWIMYLPRSWMRVHLKCKDCGNRKQDSGAFKELWAACRFCAGPVSFGCTCATIERIYAIYIWQ